ncbi:MD-2-related lipid-recognition domain-containing protein, partial [Lobosporangium transversale]
MKSFITLISTVAAASITVAAPITTATDFTYCADNSTLKLSGLTFQPDPIVPGQKVCVTVDATLSQPITKGSTIEVAASIFGIQAYSFTMDLCKALSNVNVACPIAQGSSTVNKCITVPKWIPSFTIDIKAHAKNPDGTDIICIKA